MSKYEKKGLERTPEHTPEVTPEVVPVDTGHLSGGEWNQLHEGTPKKK